MCLKTLPAETYQCARGVSSRAAKSELGPAMALGRSVSEIAMVVYFLLCILPADGGSMTNGATQGPSAKDWVALS
jgi:hypothetical protein